MDDPKNTNDQIGQFRQRGAEGTRLESLSDGVFALAIAMLLISGSLPKNYQELMTFVYDAPAFAICMLFIFWIWSNQRVFFKRYGLYDNRIQFLNFGLLFFVLFYVYPLKFLMTWLTSYFFYLLGALFVDRSYFEKMYSLAEQIPFDNLPVLMIIYGFGFLAIFSIFLLLYRHALAKKEELELNELEVYETRFSCRQLMGVIIITGISVIISIFGLVLGWALSAFWAGLTYNLIWMYSIYLSRRRKKELDRFDIAD